MTAYRVTAQALDTARRNIGASSDTELAAAVGCTPRTVQNWRAGTTGPTFAAVARLVKLSGLPFEAVAIPSGTLAAA